MQTYRASAAYVWSNCAGYTLFPHLRVDSANFAHGNAVDKELTAYVTAHLSVAPLPHMSSDAAAIAARLAQLLTDTGFTLTHPNVFTQLPLERGDIRGTADLVVVSADGALIIDFKAWYDPTPFQIRAATAQLHCYAYLSGLRDAKCVILAPTLTHFCAPIPSPVPELERVRVGEWCAYCPARLACPHHQPDAQRLALRAIASEIDPDVINAQLKALETQKALACQLAELGELPGWAMQKIQTRRRIAPWAAKQLMNAGIYERKPVSVTHPLVESNMLETYQVMGLRKIATDTLDVQN
jgi:hypothetical protein